LASEQPGLSPARRASHLERRVRENAQMTDIPDKWPVAAVLVWIATRDRAAFRIPAGNAQPNAPALCIFDRWTAANTRSAGTRPRPFWETELLDPTLLATHYILVFRHGTVRNLRPPEEVAQAKEELLARLNDGCLSAWQGERELTELKQDFTSAIFARCRDIRFETYFNDADVERVWPAGSKTTPRGDRRAPCHRNAVSRGGYAYSVRAFSRRQGPKLPKPSPAHGSETPRAPAPKPRNKGGRPPRVEGPVEVVEQTKGRGSSVCFCV
jgi:hypothetical protein